MSPVFGHGVLRLYLLVLLEEEPRHGYELIREMEDRFMGLYTPSAGTIYPRLAALEEEGLVTHDEVEGRKVYRLTDAGRRELDAKREEVEDAVSEAVRSARAAARQIRDEVRASVRDLRRELRDAVRDVRREERHTAKEAKTVSRDAAREARRAAAAARKEAGVATRQAVRVVKGSRRTTTASDLADLLRHLRLDLEAFVGDVVTAARRHELDAERMRDVRDALLDARHAVIEALQGRRGDSSGTEAGRREDSGVDRAER